MHGFIGFTFSGVKEKKILEKRNSLVDKKSTSTTPGGFQFHIHITLTLHFAVINSGVPKQNYFIFVLKYYFKQFVFKASYIEIFLSLLQKCIVRNPDPDLKGSNALDSTRSGHVALFRFIEKKRKTQFCVLWGGVSFYAIFVPLCRALRR